jgi:hypothetical protein
MMQFISHVFAPHPKNTGKQSGKQISIFLIMQRAPAYGILHQASPLRPVTPSKTARNAAIALAARTGTPITWVGEARPRRDI